MKVAYQTISWGGELPDLGDSMLRTIAKAGYAGVELAQHPDEFGSPERLIQTLSDPDETETRGHRKSFLRCFPDRKFALRVVTPLHEPDYVITAYFDRRRPCA